MKSDFSVSGEDDDDDLYSYPITPKLKPKSTNNVLTHKLFDKVDRRVDELTHGVFPV